MVARVARALMVAQVAQVEVLQVHQVQRRAVVVVVARGTMLAAMARVARL
jgi:hypothetical protein